MEEKRKRQNIYLEALETLPNLRIYEGHYLSKIITCKTCGAKWNTHEEKMTDVCIATELIIDSYKNAFDTALIISADSDLVPPITAIRNQFPCKRIVIAFPPYRDSAKLKQVSSAYFPIGESNLRKSMFADEVIKPDGFILKRPVEWA